MNIDSEQISLRAIVVDDEPSIRRLVSAALSHEGFECDTASNGEEAWARITAAGSACHLVVTDLNMPSRNGHSLAVGLLALDSRPTVVVLTGLLEPRMAKDLMARGIDDIVFKPVNFAAFAAKMWSLTKRRLLAEKSAASTESKPNEPPASQHSGRLGRVSDADLTSRMRTLASIPPASSAAVEVFRIASNPDLDARQVAGAVQRDPALVAEVIRAANSPSVNPSGKKVCDVDQAVARLGQKRVGEMALSTASLATIAQERVPFFPLSRVWRKCLAAGACLEMLLKQAYEVGSADGLFGAAILQPMSRIMLASMFPDIYERMLEQCELEHKALSEFECDVFPRSTGEVVGKVLASWGIPDDIHGVLRHATQPFSSLVSLPDQLRRRVELVKTAGFLGELAAGQFDAWELIDIPPAAVLKRLGVHAIEPLLQQCRQDLDDLLTSGGHETQPEPSAAAVAGNSRSPTLPYKRLHCGPVDFLPSLVAACGVQLVNLVGEISDAEEVVVVNAMNAPVHQCVAQARSAAEHPAIIFADIDSAERLQSCGRVVALPCSFGLLKLICVQATQAPAALDSVIAGAKMPIGVDA